jgi:dGTPase
MSPDPSAPRLAALQTREDLERDEERRLLVWAARSGRSRGRRHPEPEDPLRTVFQRDRDRVLHSTAFRRLLGKTQVFVSDTGDHYRVRLTHSLEVSQIARAISRSLRLNEDLTEAIALAHDLGHAPFGHVGGDVLAELMRGHGGFEHNRQALRIVEKIEIGYPAFEGLNLTAEVRDSLLKHGGADSAEGAVLPLEGQVVDWADGIAYNSHDLDDGLRSGILDGSEVRKLEIWRRAEDAARSRPGSGTRELHRSRVVAALIHLQVSDLVAATSVRLEAARTAPPERAVGFGEDLAQPERELRRFLYERFYTHHKVNRMRHRAREIVARLFEALTGDLGLLPPRYKRIAEEEGGPRAVSDYIAGMTDRYAQKEYGLLFLPSPGSLDP